MQRRLWPLLAVLCGLSWATPALATSTAAAEQKAAAFGAVQVGMGTASSGVALAERKKAEKNLEGNIFSSDMAAYRELMAENAGNTQKKDCRLVTKNKTQAIADAHEKAVREKLEDGPLRMFGDGGTSQRLAAVMLQRLCMNGQLTPDDFGAQWFLENGCFEDMGATHAFLKPSTILDAVTLLAPSPTQMACLNNPNDPSVCGGDTALSIWSALNDKQRRYVSAVRYCEMVAGTGRIPDHISGDTASSQAGMSAAIRNLAVLQKISASVSGCTQELAYRTAIDPLNPTLAADESIRPIAENARRLVKIATERGVPAGELKARVCAPAEMQPVDVGGDSFDVPIFQNCGVDVAGTTTYVGGPDANGGLGDTPDDRDQYYLSAYVRDHIPMYHCMSGQTAVDTDGDFGISSKKNQNKLRCVQVVATLESQDLKRKVGFMNSIFGATTVRPDFMAPPPTAARPVGYEAPPGAEEWRHEAALQEAGPRLASVPGTAMLRP